MAYSSSATEKVGVQAGGQGHRRGVRAAPAQCGDIPVFVDTLEAGDDDDRSLVQLGQNPLRDHPLDAGVPVRGVGLYPCLPAGERDHRIAHGLDCHGAQGAGDLLAGGEQHIHLPLGGVGIDLFGFGDEVVSGVALGGEDGHHVVSPPVCLSNNTGHVADAVRIRNGRPAEFLHNESHVNKYPLVGF